MIAKRFFNPLSQSMNPTWGDALVLSASSAKRYTIPADTDKILIAGTVDILVKFGASNVTVSIPVTDQLNGDAPFLNPGLIDVPADMTHVSIISASAGNVYIACWKKGAK